MKDYAYKENLTPVDVYMHHNVHWYAQQNRNMNDIAPCQALLDDLAKISRKKTMKSNR